MPHPGDQDTKARGGPDAGPVSRGMGALLTRLEGEVTNGGRLIGWKIGFNSAPVQAHFGLVEPVVGYLVEAGSTCGVQPSGGTIPIGTWTSAAVEVEVAARVGADGGLAGIGPALELVDLDLPFDDIEPILAGNVFQRGVVFGDEVEVTDPMAIEAVVSKNGEEVSRGQLDQHPADTVAFVTRFLATHGAVLEPGQRIICGSVVAPVSVVPGD